MFRPVWPSSGIAVIKSPEKDQVRQTKF